MFILTMHWDLRSLWAVLTITAHLYILCLMPAAVYSTGFLIRIAFRLRLLPDGDINFCHERPCKRFEAIMAIDWPSSCASHDTVGQFLVSRVTGNLGTVARFPTNEPSRAGLVAFRPPERQRR